jgi:hypothetical protein
MVAVVLAEMDGLSALAASSPEKAGEEINTSVAKRTIALFMLVLQLWMV